jgi:putative ATP-dependent endonuclease of the OLD family
MPTTAGLYVSRVSVRSFRCLASLDIELEPTTTVLVGENNSGKSSLLLALATALGSRRASNDDLYRDATGQVSPTAVIDVFVAPPFPTVAFSDDIRQRLIAVQREPGSDRETVGIRTILQPSGEGSLLTAKHHFLQPSSSGEWIESPAPGFQPRILKLLDAHMLDASRDLLSEMGAQTSAWGRVLSDLKIPDLPDTAFGELDPLGRRALEQALSEVSSQLRDASPVLKRLQEDLKGLARTQATVGNVNLVPLPLRVDELGKTIEVIFFQKDSAELPLRFHGLGSRSLAALLVFSTMCVLKLGQDQGIQPHLLTLLEEPEAHLHPHAVAALLSTIDGLPGQRIVATHSTTLVAETSPPSVRLLRRRAGGVSVSNLGKASPRKLEHFRRFFGRPFGEVFFARLVVLGDGIAERDALPVLVGMALGADAWGEGISFVNCESMSNHQRLNPLLAALHELGIPWLCFADNDEDGGRALTQLRDPATGTPLSPTHPSVVIPTGTKQIEQILIDADYREEITEVASNDGVAANDDHARLLFLVSNKSWAPQAIALKAKEAGKTAPPQLATLVAAIRGKLGIFQASPTPHV